MIWNGHPWRYVLGSVFMGTAHRAQYRTMSCDRRWKSGNMRLRLCRQCYFGPSLDGLVERLYHRKLIVACNGRGLV